MKIKLKRETVSCEDVEIDIEFPYYTKDESGYYHKFEDAETCLWLRSDGFDYILRKSFYSDASDILNQRITKQEFDEQLSKVIESLSKEIQ